MARYCEKLANRLLTGVQQSFDFMDGFQAGTDEYREQQLEKLDELSRLREECSSRDKELER